MSNLQAVILAILIAFIAGSAIHCNYKQYVVLPLEMAEKGYCYSRDPVNGGYYYQPCPKPHTVGQ